MFLRLINWITLALFSNHDDRLQPKLARWIVFLVPTISIIFIAFLSYHQIDRGLTQMVMERRKALTHFAAIALKDKFDRTIEVGMSLASRVQFRQLIAQGRWQEAMDILKTIPKEFSYLDRIFLTDPAGNMMADLPQLPDVIGKNFGFRDWYKGVSREWKPYVSKVYQRLAQPQHKVIAVAIPIKTDKEKILGILTLQMKLDTLLLWSRETQVDSSGFIYFVDQEGQVAAHPDFSPQGDIVDFSKVPVVEKALAGEKGVAVHFNPVEKQERLAAYEQIPNYRWVVVFQEPIESAFMIKKQATRLIILVYLLILIFNLFLASFVKQVFDIVQRHRQVLQVNQQRLATLIETAHDAIISADQKGNIISWNRSAKLMFGYSAAETLGRPLTILMPERFRAAHQAGLTHYISTGEARVIGKILQVTALRKNGEEFPIELSISTWKTYEGSFFTAIIRDVSTPEMI